ncbi:glycosyltransferase [Adhaeribacter terreus]|uniref:Glycosyltransferase n=1 Tax=Adhaeribacter terreus TaxID=529703 RepID=A0ABW0E8T0_9BACT
MILIGILFWVSVLLVLHTYLFFPLLLKMLSAGKKQYQLVFSETDELPEVAVLLAAYNEEAVIEEKIRSTFRTNYPRLKIALYIGSDNSTDATNVIVERLKTEFPEIQFFPFAARTGKIGIINHLAQETKASILIHTDANVFFDEHTIFQLVKHFKNPEIGLVGGNILNQEVKREGISVQEKAYLQRENLMKYQEGVLWGTMMGAFGGCFAMRRANFVPTPQNFIVDDFYLSLKVLEQGKKAINELQAVCYEDVSNQLSEEFRRKVRISTGNFQNLHTFRHLLWPPFTGLAFSFLSHKVIRWYTPFLLLLIFFSNFALLSEGWLYKLTFAGQLLLPATILLDWLLKKKNIHVRLFRFITHFYGMNLALLQGWLRYRSGVKTSVWTPTKRNQ